jgi:hypothetical protein
MVIAHRTHRTILQCTPVSPYYRCHRTPVPPYPPYPPGAPYPGATAPPVSPVVRWTGGRCTVTGASLSKLDQIRMSVLNECVFIILLVVAFIILLLPNLEKGKLIIKSFSEYCHTNVR